MTNIDSLITQVVLGKSPTTLLEIAIDEACTEADTSVRTFFDAYGDLRFSSLNGVLIHELTPTMTDLVKISDEARTNNDLIELIGSYEGPISRLYNEVLARRRRPQGPPDPHRSLVARRSAHKHASNRETAARKSAVSAVGKAAHKAVGRLNSRASR